MMQLAVYTLVGYWCGYANFIQTHMRSTNLVCQKQTGYGAWMPHGAPTTNRSVESVHAQGKHKHENGMKMELFGIEIAEME